MEAQNFIPDENGIRNVVLTRLAGIGGGLINTDAPLGELVHFGIDSLTLVQLLIEVERTFSISISDVEVAQAKSINDLIRLIALAVSSK